MGCYKAPQPKGGLAAEAAATGALGLASAPSAPAPSPAWASATSSRERAMPPSPWAPLPCGPALHHSRGPRTRAGSSHRAVQVGAQGAEFPGWAPVASPAPCVSLTSFPTSLVCRHPLSCRGISSRGLISLSRGLHEPSLWGRNCSPERWRGLPEDTQPEGTAGLAPRPVCLTPRA